jgi:hypothetical protein
MDIIKENSSNQGEICEIKERMLMLERRLCSISDAAEPVAWPPAFHNSDISQDLPALKKVRCTRQDDACWL